MEGSPLSKRHLLLLALASILLDSGLSLLEIPFGGALPFAITVEEILELVISSLLAGNRLKLTWLDRTLGFLPIPGVTAITVHLIRNWFQNSKSKKENP
ncbi:MAG: hypothetical protein KGP28_06435 [Bdellovibrionales bacterium]|nr:hypothetical protein [Bdellovibrionales bacterium]